MKHNQFSRNQNQKLASAPKPAAALRVVREGTLFNEESAGVRSQKIPVLVACARLMQTPRHAESES